MLNENGQRPLELFSFNKPWITNTFATKPHRRMIWRHSRSKHWHQLDFVITQKFMLNYVSLTRSYHSADCDTDLSLVVRKVCLRPEQFYRSKQKGCSCVETSRVMKQELMEQFFKVIEEAFENCLTDSAQAIWDFILDECTRLSFTPYGKGQRKTKTGFRLV